MADTKEPRATIKSAEIVAYLEELVRLGIYGSQPGSVATWIVRKEVARLIEAGVLKPIQFVPKGESGDDED